MDGLCVGLYVGVCDGLYVYEGLCDGPCDAQDPNDISTVNTSQYTHVSTPIVELDTAGSANLNEPVPNHFVRMLDLTNPNISDYTLDMS